jgi:hypothetical protein
MNRQTLSVACATIVALLLLAAPAAAQNMQSWLASTGSDASACTRAAPCAGLERALSQTDAGGQINCVDRMVLLIAAGSNLQITKSITIDCEGTTIGSSGVSGSVMINISAGATGVVHLRGMTINAAGRISGLGVGRSAQVHLDRMTFEGYSHQGVNILSTFDTTLFVTDTVFTNGGGASSGAAIIMQAVAADIHVELTRVTIKAGGGGGVLINRGNSDSGSISLKVRDSNISGNALDGIAVTGPGIGAHQVDVMLQKTQIAGNGGAALSATGGGAHIVATNTRITGNGTGISASGGATVLSAGGNVLAGNGTDGAFTGTISKQ